MIYQTESSFTTKINILINKFVFNYLKQIIVTFNKKHKWFIDKSDTAETIISGFLNKYNHSNLTNNNLTLTTKTDNVNECVVISNKKRITVYQDKPQHQHEHRHKDQCSKQNIFDIINVTIS
jgi:hypothetical protein